MHPTLPLNNSNTMTNPSTIEQAVMRRVRTVHRLRPFVSMGALAVVVAAFALYGIGREVWVARVFENGPQDLFGRFLYLVYAFEHTRFVVQALVAATLASTVYLARLAADRLARTLTFA